VEKEEIPTDTVAAPSPGQVSRWAGFLDKVLAGKKARFAGKSDDFVLTLVFDDRRALSLATHPNAALVALLDESPPFIEDLPVLKENLGGLTLARVASVSNEPVLIFSFTGPLERKLVWEGMRRSANVLLLDPGDMVLWALRSFNGEFRTGAPLDTWRPPPPRPAAGAAENSSDPGEEVGKVNRDHLLAFLLEKARSRRIKSFQAKMKSLEKKRDALSRESGEASEWLMAEPSAKALIASGNLRRRGDRLAKVADYSSDPPKELAIELDPTLTVLENAERMFRLVRKGRERLKLLPGRIASVDGEIADLKTAMERAASETDLLALSGQPAAKNKAAARKKEESKLPKNVASFDLPRGFKGYAGRNAGGNDYVSFRVAKGEDFWFHVADYKGSHVVVRNPSRLDELPLDTEIAAAKYAAAHSSAPSDCEVEVTVTKVKFLSRVPKRPGAVYVSAFRKRLVDLARNG